MTYPVEKVLMRVSLRVVGEEWQAVLVTSVPHSMHGARASAKTVPDALRALAEKLAASNAR